MSQMTGADIGDLERGAASLESLGGRIGAMARPLRSQLYSSHWHGGAAERFRHEWDSVHAPGLAQAEDFLRSAGHQLRREAEEQRRASGHGGSGIGAAPAALIGILAGASGAWARRSSVAERVGEWTSEDGQLTASGRVVVGSADGSASMGAGMDGDSYRAHAEARGRLALLEAQGEVRYGNESIGAGARADAMVGVDAGVDASAQIGPDGVSVGAGGEAFAGARVEASGDVELGAVGAGATAEGWAGVGVEADADASITMEEVSISVSFGAALGLGGSVGGTVSFSPKKVLEGLTKWPW